METRARCDERPDRSSRSSAVGAARSWPPSTSAAVKTIQARPSATPASPRTRKARSNAELGLVKNIRNAAKKDNIGGRRPGAGARLPGKVRPPRPRRDHRRANRQSLAQFSEIIVQSARAISQEHRQAMPTAGQSRLDIEEGRPPMIRMMRTPAWPVPIESTGQIWRCARQLARQHGRARRWRARNDGLDLLAWGQKYLPDHFRPAAVEHAPLAGRAARRGPHARGTKLNVLGPRGGAKSTIGTLCLAAVRRGGVLGAIYLDRLRHQHQACAHLENLKAELLENRQLAEDFPEVVGRGLVVAGQLDRAPQRRDDRGLRHGPTHSRPPQPRAPAHADHLRRPPERRPHPLGPAARPFAKLVPRHADEGGHRPNQRREPCHGPAPRGPGDGTAPHARLDVATSSSRSSAGPKTSRSGNSGRPSTPICRSRTIKSAARTFYDQHRQAMDAGRDRALAGGRGPLYADVHAGRRRAGRPSSARSRTRRSTPTSANGPSRISTRRSGSTSGRPTWP